MGKETFQSKETDVKNYQVIFVELQVVDLAGPSSEQSRTDCFLGDLESILSDRFWVP